MTKIENILVKGGASPASGHVAAGHAPASGHRNWASAVEAALGPLVEIPAAALVVAEIVVLLAGVTARYVFHQPLVWSDELASILFLWLAMLGSVVAFRRGEHRRMTAFVGMASPAVRAFLEVVAITAPLAFLLLIVYPGFEFVYEETYITTPALEIQNAWRAAAIPVGTVLMIAMAVLRLGPVGSWRRLLRAAAPGVCPGCPLLAP